MSEEPLDFLNKIVDNIVFVFSEDDDTDEIPYRVHLLVEASEKIRNWALHVGHIGENQDYSETLKRISKDQAYDAFLREVRRGAGDWEGCLAYTRRHEGPPKWKEKALKHVVDSIVSSSARAKATEAYNIYTNFCLKKLNEGRPNWGLHREYGLLENVFLKVIDAINQEATDGWRRSQGWPGYG